MKSSRMGVLVVGNKFGLCSLSSPDLATDHPSKTLTWILSPMIPKMFASISLNKKQPNVNSGLLNLNILDFTNSHSTSLFLSHRSKITSFDLLSLLHH